MLTADSIHVFLFLQHMINIHSVTVSVAVALFCIIAEFIPEIHIGAFFTFLCEASDTGQGQIPKILQKTR